MEVKDYLVSENMYKEYMLELIGGEIVWSYIASDTHEDPPTFYKERGCGADSYGLSEIKCVVQELPEDFNNDCYQCDVRGSIDVKRALSGETVCDDCKIQEAKLTPFTTNQSRVYKYDNLDQLQKLYDILGNPIGDNFDVDHGDRKINTKQLKSTFGVMYTWSHMDDFADYPLDYCAIIEWVAIHYG